MAGRNKETIKASQLDFNAKLVGSFMIRGSINGLEYIYNYACDIYPRFIGYKASKGEIEYLKKLLDVFLQEDEIRDEIALTMFK